ncbi:MAG: hypothetical protein R3F19_00660 [Verrucomicrobiales bacterium]
MAKNSIISKPLHRIILAGALGVAGWPVMGLCQDPPKPTIPDELVLDEHLREEYGVNQFTTPSIKKLFEELESFGSLPYEKLKRDIPNAPRDRSLVALSLGVLIADGFLTVNADEILDLRDVGGAILKHAKILGSGNGAIRHVKTILESSALDELDALKNELSRTQVDVEKEMVLLRDVDIAHLVGLGGWVRALQIGSHGSLDPYNPARAQKLIRTDLVEYFQNSLSELDPSIRDSENITRISRRLDQVVEIIKAPAGPGGTLTVEQVKDLADKSDDLVKLSTREFKVQK